MDVPHTSYHHGSHTHLLRPVVPHADRPAGVNAIIVPTARPHTYLGDASELAGHLGCQLILLCSGWADAARAVEQARARGLRAVAVDIGDVPSLPRFETTAILSGTRFERKTDTSLKRNLGLALSRMVGWGHVLFLDDDIRVEQPDDIRHAAALADTYAAVGLANNGFPDNSVVCHAYRKVGGSQDSFIGGGALVVPGSRTLSFFPNIYNEDWFFLLDDDRLSPVAVTGKVTQKEYDPFRDASRARSEEFGDCIAEGVYALLDDGKKVHDADADYWRGYLEVRRRLIDDVLSRLPGAGLDAAERRRIVEALKGAQGRREFITPEMCVSYLRAWSADRKRWQTYLRRLPRKQSAEQALRYLGLRPRTSD